MRVLHQILPDKNASYLSNIMNHCLKHSQSNIHEIFGRVDETMAVVALYLTRPWGNS
jgi:hypothetical protein